MQACTNKGWGCRGVGKNGPEKWSRQGLALKSASGKFESFPIHNRPIWVATVIIALICNEKVNCEVKRYPPWSQAALSSSWAMQWSTPAWNGTYSTLKNEANFPSKKSKLLSTQLEQRFLCRMTGSKTENTKFLCQRQSITKNGIFISLTSHDAECDHSAVSLGNRSVFCEGKWTLFLRVYCFATHER